MYIKYTALTLMALPVLGAIDLSDLTMISRHSCLHKQSMGDVNLYHARTGFVLKRPGSTTLLYPFQMDRNLRNISLRKLQAFLDVGYIHIKELSDGEIYLEARARGLGGGLDIPTAAALFVADQIVEGIAEAIKETAKDRKIEEAAGWADGVLNQTFPAAEERKPTSYMSSTVSESIHPPRASGFTYNEEMIHAQYPSTRGMNAHEIREKYNEEVARISSKEQADILRAQAQVARDEQAQLERDLADKRAREELARYNSPEAVKARSDEMVAKTALQALDKGMISIPQDPIDTRCPVVVMPTPLAPMFPWSKDADSEKAFTEYCLKNFVWPAEDPGLDCIPTVKSSSPTHVYGANPMNDMLKFSQSTSQDNNSRPSAHREIREPITLIGPAKIDLYNDPKPRTREKVLEETARQYFIKSNDQFNSTPFRSYNPTSTWNPGNPYIPSVFGSPAPYVPSHNQLGLMQEAKLVTALGIKTFQQYDAAKSMVTSILPKEMIKDTFKPIVSWLPQEVVNLAAIQLMSGASKEKVVVNTTLGYFFGVLSSYLRW